MKKSHNLSIPEAKSLTHLHVRSIHTEHARACHAKSAVRTHLEDVFLAIDDLEGAIWCPLPDVACVYLQTTWVTLLKEELG